MFSAVTSFFSSLVLRNDAAMDMEDVDRMLKNVEKENLEAKKEVEEIFCDYKDSCFYSTGIVSALREEYVLIDNKYLCDINRVSINVKVGDKVRYFAYQLDRNKEMKIHKIVDHCDSLWDDDNEENKIVKESEPIVKKQMMSRTLVGKVMKREGRSVFIEPHNINFNLDNVRSEFIPLAGDWVTVSSLVEVEANAADLNGEVLEIDSIAPLRSKLHTGLVTTYNVGTGVGVVDRTTIFTKGVCEAGYIPCVGDKVVTDSIESDQGAFAWRSLTIVPLSSKVINSLFLFTLML